MLKNIINLVSEHSVDKIVLGMPKNLNGTLGERADVTESFLADLKRELPDMEIVLWDERRTTIDAHQILFNSGKNAKKRKKVVDAVAASLILEGYLTFKKSHS